MVPVHSQSDFGVDIYSLIGHLYQLLVKRMLKINFALIVLIRCNFAHSPTSDCECKNLRALLRRLVAEITCIKFDYVL